MPSRFRSIAFVAAAAGVLAVSGVAAPAGAATTHPQGKAGPACSTEIEQGAGAYHPPNIAFSYDLSGPSCRDALYTLIVRNIYNRSQWAFYATRGDGTSTKISFVQPLPFTPTEPPDAGNRLGGGLCVTAVVIRHARIAYVAPSNAPCMLLDNGNARAFH